MREVSKATLAGDMGSLGHATNKLICQFEFPFQYENDETMIQADHDRMLEWDYDYVTATFRRHMNTGELGLANWAPRAGGERVIALLKDLFKVDEDYPSTQWTGYRITGTVNWSNGYPVYSLWLFAKRKGSKTKGYSGSNAPNVGSDDAGNAGSVRSRSLESGVAKSAAVRCDPGKWRRIGS